MKINKEYEYKTYTSVKKFILGSLVCDEYKVPFKLTKWEEDLIEDLGDPDTLCSMDIKRIVIITPRKTGATYFCKILHWLKPEGIGTYVISENLDKSNMIKRMDIKTNDTTIIKTNSGKVGVDCFYPVSFESVKKHGLKPIKQYDNEFATSEMQTKASQNEKIHVMLDLEKYDKEIIDTIEALNPDFMTIVIKVDDDIYNDIIRHIIDFDFEIQSNLMFYKWVQLQLFGRKDTYGNVIENTWWNFAYINSEHNPYF